MRKIILTAVVLFTYMAALAQTYDLEQCQAMAAENNRTLKSKRMDMDKAKSDEKSAFMHYFPTVSANAAGFLSADELMRGDMKIDISGVTESISQNPALAQELATKLPTTLGTISQMPTSLTMPLSFINRGVVATISALEPIYTGGQIINGNKLAKLQSEVKELQYSMSEREIQQSVTQYYWTVQTLRGTIKTIDAADQQLEQLHKQVKQYVDAGVTNRNDLLKVELKQQEMQSNRLKAENGEQLAQMVLAQLIGADIKTFRVADEQIDNPKQPAEYFEDSDAAVAQRDEVALTQKAVDASKLQLKMEQGKNLPTLAIGVAGVYYNMASDNIKTFRAADEQIDNPKQPAEYFEDSDAAVAQRDEVALTQKAVDASKLQLKMEQGKNLPTLAIGVAGVYYNMASDNIKMKNVTNLVGMATLSVPISSWWSKRHDINKAKQNVAQAELTRQETEEKLHIDVQNAWNSLNEAYSQIGIAKKSVESSTENLRLNQDYYKVGQTTMSDLLDAVTLYTQSCDKLNEAYANYQIKVADYIQKTR